MGANHSPRSRPKHGSLNGTCHRQQPLQRSRLSDRSASGCEQALLGLGEGIIHHFISAPAAVGRQVGLHALPHRRGQPPNPGCMGGNSRGGKRSSRRHSSAQSSQGSGRNTLGRVLPRQASFSSMHPGRPWRICTRSFRSRPACHAGIRLDALLERLVDRDHSVADLVDLVALPGDRQQHLAALAPTGRAA